MAKTLEVPLPDIGDFESVDVVDVLVAPGDRVEAETPLIVLESDKATMDVPSPAAGVVQEVRVRVGDKVSTGHPILLLELAEGAAPERASAPAGAPPDRPAEPAASSDAEAAPVAATAGGEDAPDDRQAASASAPEAPARSAGRAASATTGPRAAAEPDAALDPARLETMPGGPAAPPVPAVEEAPPPPVPASPAVRKLARELGVDVAEVAGSGRTARVLAEDVRAYVRGVLRGAPAPAGPGSRPGTAAAEGRTDPGLGPVAVEPVSKLRRAAAANLHRSWTTVPHVTQHDEADVTELEAFRREAAAAVAGAKLTLLPFLVKAVVSGLRAHPRVNTALDESGESLVWKRHFHLSIAVDTPEGLLVPVVRDADRKSLAELAREIADLAERARARKLAPREMQGGCFTISSLGGVGGTAFTPIVNAPEVAILGVSPARVRPVWRDGAVVPRAILPLSLSYDHRVVDGALAARFTSHLAHVLADVRRLLL